MPAWFTPRALGPFWSLYEAIAMVVGLGLLGLICLGWLPCAVVLLLLPGQWRQRLARRWHSWVFRFYLGFLSRFCACRFDLDALDTLPKQGPLVVVANHPSLLDAVLIISRLPNMVCIMKAALLRNPLLGAAAQSAGYISNAGPLEMMLNARAAIAQGAQLLVFPEGSRTVDFPIDACSPSAGVLARAAGVPVQTLLIECSTPYLGKAWPLLRRPRLPLHFRVVLGRRFDVPDDIATMTQQMESYFRSELQARPPLTQDERR
jgi:1-acyl-sn-glycerol-3-phosphate acyltransferase